MIDDLIAKTRAQAGSLQPLDLLASAARRQQELADLGEQLLDHFVQEARAAGCSWSQIGSALGVTKQAAQQRHSAARSLLGRIKNRGESGGLFTRFRPRARQVVVLAQQEAQRLRHDHIGTEHLLLGLAAEGLGISARALDSVGITLDAARAGVEGLLGCGEADPTGHIPFTPRAKKVLELGLRQSIHLGHNYIGTEHILLGLLTEGKGVGMQVIRAVGVQPDQLQQRVSTLLGR